MRESSVKKCEINHPADTNVREEGGIGDERSAGAEVFLPPVEKTMAMQVVTLEPMEDCFRAGICNAPREGPHTKA